MKRLLSLIPLVALSIPALAQHDIPADAMKAKTIAIINDTKSEAVQKGAEEALTSWGHFKLVDEPEAADITIRFEKKHERDTTDTQGTGPDGKQTWSSGTNFSTATRMKVFLKDAASPFFSEKIDGTKKNDGLKAVDDLRSAMEDARRK